MRRLLPLLAFLVPVAAVAQAPAAGGQPPALRIPGLSPAGVAVLDRLKGQQNPAIPKQVQDEQAVQQQMQAVLSAPNIDLDKFAAAQTRARAVMLGGRKIIDDNIITVLRALSPADRKAFIAAVTHPQLAGGAAPGR